MPKATIANLKDLGFQAEQFDAAVDWDTEPDGYLDRILQRIGTVVEDVVGATTYAGITSGALFYHLVSAEEQLVAAELWQRLEVAERARLGVNSGQQGTETIGSRLLANARAAEEKAWEALGKVTGEDYSGGFSVGNVASGKFAEAS